MGFTDRKEYKDFLIIYNSKKQERIKESRVRNKEKIRLRDKKFYQKNKEKIKIRVMEYEKNNKNKKNIYAKKNRLKMNKYMRDRRINNMQVIIQERIRSRLREVTNNYVKNGKIPSSIKIDWKSIIKHLDETKPKNWKQYHIDHIFPLSKLDLTDPIQLKFANSPENLQWLSPKNNIKKRDSVIK